MQPEPPADCDLCPRLVQLREKCAAERPDWFNGAVPSFAPALPNTTKLLIVGLAPGMKGANKTGRSFTGDQAGDLLYTTLATFGFATGSYAGHRHDGLQLVETMVTNAVRCVPPGNRPTAAEISTCRPFLRDRIGSLQNLRAILALGRIAHDSTLTALGKRKSAHSFSHGALHDIGGGLMLFDSYHCSRYNINTRRLTPKMFKDVFREIRAFIG